MRILFIDTCTERGIIAYGNSTDLLLIKELPVGLHQSHFLMPYLEEILKPFGFPPPLDIIGVGAGPGSYTGIRIGVAVAQTLAYAWKIPLVTVSSLDGFVPSTLDVHYAAVIDARIGGVYFQTGWMGREGSYQGSPQIAPIEQIGQYLEKITHLVTPMAKSLQAKLSAHYPHSEWAWEERSPSIPLLFKKIEKHGKLGQVIVPPQQIEVLYLRQTEAEREKLQSQQSSII